MGLFLFSTLTPNHHPHQTQSEPSSGANCDSLLLTPHRQRNRPRRALPADALRRGLCTASALRFGGFFDDGEWRNRSVCPC